MLGADYSAVRNTSRFPDAQVEGYAAQSSAHHKSKGSASHTAAVVAQVEGHSSSPVENILVEDSDPQAGEYWR